jgi:titin
VRGADKPSPPRNFLVTAFDKDFVDLKWDVPESDGGEPITEYIVERRDVKKTAFVSQGKTDAKTLNLKATKLIEGTQYMFRVIAVNSIGQSEPTELAEPVTAKVPFDPPGPPLNLRAEETTKTSAIIRFEPPEADGGSPVTGYYVEKSVNGKWTRVNKKAVATCEVAMEELKENASYTVRALAENAAGVGQPSAELSFVAKSQFQVPGKPGTPVIENLTETSAELSWSAPTTDGGSPITNYIVEVRKKGEQKWKASSVNTTVVDRRYTVTALLKGAEYEFRVTAENKVGPGEPSDPTQPVKYG